MDQVARRARLSRALLYVYFNDKATCTWRWSSAPSRRSATLRRGPGRPAERHRRRSRPSAAPISPFPCETPHYFDACARYQAHPAGEVARRHAVNEAGLRSSRPPRPRGDRRLADRAAWPTVRSARTSAIRTSPHCALGIHARHDPDRLHQGRPDRARRHIRAVVHRAWPRPRAASTAAMKLGPALHPSPARRRHRVAGATLRRHRLSRTHRSRSSPWKTACARSSTKRSPPTSNCALPARPCSNALPRSTRRARVTCR